jgi:hypothetical protein
LPLRVESEQEARRLWGNLYPVDANDEIEAQDAFDRAEADESERKVLWRLLAAYQLNDTYESFCSWLGLQLNEQTEALYKLTHACYVVGWNRYGWDRLQVMCKIGWNGLYLNDRRLM